MTRWENYAFCETCGAPAGAACHDLRYSPRTGVFNADHVHRGRLPQKLEVTVTLTLTVDTDGWADEYSLPRLSDTIEKDVLNYVDTQIASSHPGMNNLIEITAVK